MNFFISNRKKISLMVMAAFLLLLHTSSCPLYGERGAKAPEEYSTATKGADDTATPGAVEKAGSRVVKAKKGFPWLLVAAGLVAAGTAVYLLTKKKPVFNLTVTMGDGASGNLPAGTQAHKKGSRVAYNFMAKDGYKKLAVTLDGMPAAASGSVAMDRDHTLAASAVEGIDEQFTNEASPLWQARNLSHWSVGNGSYICSATYGPIIWDYNVYNYNFSQNQFILEVRVKHTQGDALALSSNIGLFTSHAPMTSTSGFTFNISADGRYSINKLTNFNLDTYTGSTITIDSGSHSAIISGLGQWNVLRVARSGSSYTFYINGTVIHTFSDGSIDPRYVVLLPVGLIGNNSWEYDYFVMSMGNTLPTAAVKARLPAKF